MKAIVLDKVGDASGFQSKDIPIPSPKEGEVRIQIRAAGFNPVDFKIRRGDYGTTTPVILGADCSGVIDSIGPKVTSFKVGDEVFAIAFGQGSNGSYAEYLCLPEQFVAKKPSHLSFTEAASIPLATLTAYRAVIASGAITNREPIFIAGAAGGVGSMGVQLARHLQAGPIYTVAGSEESLDCMTQTLKIDPHNIVLYKGLSTEALQEKLTSLNSGSLFTSTFDYVGKEMKTLCLNLAKPSGHMVTTVPEDESYSTPVWTRGISPCFSKNLSVHFIFIGAESFLKTPKGWQIYQEQLAKIGELLASRAILPPQIKNLGDLSVATIQKAHGLLEGGKVKGKLVMQVS